MSIWQEVIDGVWPFFLMHIIWHYAAFTTRGGRLVDMWGG